MGRKERPKQIMPIGHPLPTVIDCVPNHMFSSATAGFRTTSWTLVLAAGRYPTADSRQALTQLCEIYWQPIYAFIRRKGHDRNQAEDLTQEFFARLLEKEYLADADRERGKFRSFLLTAVKHFLANEWDRAHTQKRGGGQGYFSVDQIAAEGWYALTAVEEATPETLFENRWALSLLEHVMVKLRSEFTAIGKADQFDQLSSILNREPESARYDELAEQMGMSVGALRMAVHRMRRKYGRMLRAEIAETVSKPEQIDDEIRFLLAVLGR
jgi:RNA polymerase sigma factor (sigma-70 family)